MLIISDLPHIWRCTKTTSFPTTNKNTCNINYGQRHFENPPYVFWGPVERLYCIEVCHLLFVKLFSERPSPQIMSHNLHSDMFKLVCQNVFWPAFLYRVVNHWTGSILICSRSNRYQPWRRNWSKLANIYSEVNQEVCSRNWTSTRLPHSSDYI